MTYRPLAFEHIPAGMRQRRSASVLAIRIMSRALLLVGGRNASRQVVERTLAKHLPAAGTADMPAFFLPMHFGVRAFGEALWLDLPVQNLHTRLHDWIGHEDAIVHSSDYFFCSGDWSPLLAAADGSPVMTEATQLLQANLDYRSTRIYAKHRQLIESGKTLSRNQVALDTVQKLDDYFDRFVALFKSIQTHGVLPLADARAFDTSLDKVSELRRWDTHVGEKDIGVALGPSGEIVVLPGAKHRLAIATTLRLTSVPVQLRMIHVDWLHKLDKPSHIDWCQAVEQALLELKQAQR